jgi:hypothetical protein
MPETLTLPNGETVTPEDVFLFDGYPYRFVPAEDGFYLSPLYWGGGEMDVPFASEAELADRWEGDSRGTLRDEEWRAWLREARHDDRFSDEELDHVARELGLERGLLARIRGLLGR